MPPEHGREKHQAYAELVKSAEQCRRCSSLCERRKVLSSKNGPITAKLMFIAEAPGRLGAEITGIPLFGDKTGDNFGTLLKSCGIDRSDIFITNSVLCNPTNSDGNNRPPKSQEIANCSSFLRRQIELVDPPVIVTLGAKALSALARLEKHQLALQTHVATKNVWLARTLVPLYHPSPLGMISRRLDQQRSDFAFVAGLLCRGVS